MIETKFLEGKVTRQSLPIMQGAPGPDAPPLKRLLLPQGELAQIYDADEAIRYLAFIELRPQTTRGNHYHNTKIEIIYVLEGDLELVVEDIRSKRRESTPLLPGDMAIIQTGVAHALNVLATGKAIEFSPARFNAADTHRYPLI